MDHDRLRRYHTVCFYSSPRPPHQASFPSHVSASQSNGVTQHVRGNARCSDPRPCGDSHGHPRIRRGRLDANRDVLLLHVRLRRNHVVADGYARGTNLLQRRRQEGRNHHVVLCDTGAVLHWVFCHVGECEDGVGFFARRCVSFLWVSFPHKHAVSCIGCGRRNLFYKRYKNKTKKQAKLTKTTLQVLEQSQPVHAHACQLSLARRSLLQLPRSNRHRQHANHHSDFQHHGPRTRH